MRSNLLNQILLAFALLTFSRLIWFTANAFWLPPIGIDEYIWAHLVGIYFFTRDYKLLNESNIRILLFKRKKSI